MLDQEFWQLVARIQERRCEEQTIEVKTAARGCPERLYDTFPRFPIRTMEVSLYLAWTSGNSLQK